MNKYALSILLVLFFLSVPVSGYCTRCAASNITATIDVNYTFTGAPGTDALVTNIGSNVDALLDFTVPAGADGVMEGNVSHNLLLNLTTSDDHSQYAYLPGRAGGQTLNGGAGNNENLMLFGTSSLVNSSSVVQIQTGGANSKGRVKIGSIDSPKSMLDINGNVTVWTASPKGLYLFGNGAGLDFSGGNNRIYFAGYRALENAAATNARLDIGEHFILTRIIQNLSIVTSSPTAQFDTTGSVRFRNCSGTPTMDAGGNMTCVSDEKYKTAITPYISSSSKLSSVSPKQFKWSASSGFDTTHLNTGFSAQEIQAIYPECVIARDDIIYKQVCDKEENCETQEIKTGIQTLSIDDKCLIAVLWNAAKEQGANNTAQQIKINELEARLTKLELVAKP